MSRKPVTEIPIVQIKAAQSGTGQHGKSELYKWMWDHFDQLEGIGAAVPIGWPQPSNTPSSG